MAYTADQVAQADAYLKNFWNALQGQSHGILNAWNTEGQAGADAANPYFQTAMQQAGPGVFQPGQALAGNQDLKSDPAFQAAVWAGLAPNVGGQGDVFGHIISTMLGQSHGGYDLNRGWPLGDGTYSGDAGLRAGGFDPNNLPAWYHAGGGGGSAPSPAGNPPAAPPQTYTYPQGPTPPPSYTYPNPVINPGVPPGQSFQLPPPRFHPPHQVLPVGPYMGPH